MLRRQHYYACSEFLSLKKKLGMLSSCMPASLTILAPFLVSCQGKERPNQPRLGVPNAMQLGNWISHLPFNLVALVCHGMTELAARSLLKKCMPGLATECICLDAYPGKSPSTSGHAGIGIAGGRQPPCGLEALVSYSAHAVELTQITPISLFRFKQTAAYNRE